MPPFTSCWTTSLMIFCSSSEFFCSALAGAGECASTMASKTSAGFLSPSFIRASREGRSSVEARLDDDGDCSVLSAMVWSIDEVLERVAFLPILFQNDSLSARVFAILLVIAENSDDGVETTESEGEDAPVSRSESSSEACSKP